MKFHPNASVVFVTFTVEEGLLLLANPLCESILKSCLAAAQKLYPVKVCHFIVEATHIHMIVVVYNPSDLPAFVGHFKTESAHMINRLLGREKRTLWCEGYDSPVVLTFTRAVIALVYLYCNPAKDHLVRSIDEYPGFSSWKMFRDGVLTKNWKRLRRPLFRALAPDSHNLRGYTKEAERLLGESDEIESFILHPNAWLEAFGITDSAEQERINTRIVERIKTVEARAEKFRIKHNKRLIGREKLMKQVMDTTYKPSRRGKRTCCLSHSRSIRIAFITAFKLLKQEARKVLAKWRMGDTSAKYPPGLYPPSMPKLADVLIT